MKTEKPGVDTGEWVVHIDVKIWGTIVWEGIVRRFTEKQDARNWQDAFMKHAPRECSAALIPVDQHQSPQELARYLKAEISRYIRELMEENHDPTAHL